MKINWHQRNYRRRLMTGIRAKIAREPFGMRLIALYTALFDATELAS